MKHSPASAAFYRPAGGPPTKGKAYVGRLLASSPQTPGIFDANATANLQMPKLWNKARPAQPKFEGLNAFYELKDVPGMLKQRFHSLTPGGIGSFAGDLYIGEQFGWMPLLRDVRDFYFAHHGLKAFLDQLKRDEGKAVRRTAKLKAYQFENVMSDVESYGAFYPTLVTQCYAGIPHFVDTYRFSSEVWFSGAFRYWLPQGRDDWRWRGWMNDRIFGLNPTPSRVYKAIPWTWLVDWFSNLGPVIEQMSSGIEERLATDYAYCMCRIQASWERRSYGNFYASNNYDDVRTFTSTCRITREHKARIPAGVFGPSVTNDLSLSPTQTSILGALGLSKSRPGARYGS